MLITNEAQHTLVFHLQDTSALTYCLPRLISDFLNVHAVRRYRLVLIFFFCNIDIKIIDKDKDKSRALHDMNYRSLISNPSSLWLALQPLEGLQGGEKVHYLTR